MIYSTIETLLTGQVGTITGLPDWQRENERYTGKTSIPFIRTTMLPAEPQVMTAGANGITKYQGLFQIDCFIGQDKGKTEALAMADLVLASFKEGLKLTSGTVTVEVVTASTQPAYQMSSYYGVPCVIRWHSYYTKA